MFNELLVEIVFSIGIVFILLGAIAGMTPKAMENFNFISICMIFVIMGYGMTTFSLESMKKREKMNHNSLEFKMNEKFKDQINGKIEIIKNNEHEFYLVKDLNKTYEIYLDKNDDLF